MSTECEVDQMTKEELARKQAAAVLGRKGGRAGVGDSKRRSKSVIKKAVRARIKANRERKAAAISA